jgi:MFS transporter, UMF1 family
MLQRLGLHRPELRAWALYDWANSAMVTIVITAVFPIFFAKVAAADLPPEVATQRFTLATTVSQVCVAVLAPILGALADFSARKKRFLIVFLLLGAVATAAMFFIERGDWLFAAALFMLANLGASGSFVFYDALLPHVARDEELDRVSTSAYALGYIGGGLLLGVVLAWIQWPARFGFPADDPTLPARAGFFACAVWWVAFSIPLFRRVSEPPRRLEADEQAGDNALRVAWTRLGETFRDLRRYRDAFLMLIAFLLYNDGIGTIIRMATIYGTELNLPSGDLMAAILLVQFIGVPCAIVFGRLAERFSAKRAILFTIVVYLAISILAYRMHTRGEFYALAIGVGLVQGGAQALSRSLFATMVPKHKSAEFFGLFAVLEKFAGIFGPSLFLLANTLTHSSRLGILTVVLSFVAGGLVLLKVNPVAGRAAARLADSQAH